MSRPVDEALTVGILAAHARHNRAGEGPTVTVEATQFTVCAVSQQVKDWHMFALTVARTAPDRWTVRRHSRCLAADGTWDYESIPSERTDEWLARFRHDFATAMRLAQEAAPKVTVNGWTVERANAEWHREGQ